MDMAEQPVLNWNISELMAAHDLNPSRLSAAAGIHPYTIGQMAKNLTGRVSLETLARLATTLRCALATAPGGAQDDFTLLVWANGKLVWNLTALMKRDHIPDIKTLYFAVGIERTALIRFADGTATQASITSLERLCRHFSCALAGPPPGVASTESLLVWASARVEQPHEELEDESPIPGEPSRVCKGPVCKAITPQGVEKRIDAFPISGAYRHGRGPICKACRREQERRRRAAKKSRAAKNALKKEDS